MLVGGPLRWDGGAPSLWYGEAFSLMGDSFLYVGPPCCDGAPLRCDGPSPAVKQQERFERPQAQLDAAETEGKCGGGRGPEDPTPLQGSTDLEPKKRAVLSAFAIFLTPKPSNIWWPLACARCGGFKTAPQGAPRRHAATAKAA